MKKQSWLYIILVIFILSTARTPLYCQIADEVNLKLEKSVFLQEKRNEKEVIAPYLSFPNSSKDYFHYDPKALKAINDAEEEQNLPLLDQLLTSYIAQFGPENFQKNLELIWKAGQVKELLQDTVQALLYYELGIKNQRPTLEKVQLHYDSLIAPYKTEWVDLKFYYKLLEARRKVDPLIPPRGVMLNMGPKINTDKPEYAPFMHPSDSVLIFSARRDDEIIIDKFNENYNEELYYSEKDFVSGTWTIAKKFTEEINSRFNEGSACLSPDGKTLFFTRCDAPSGFGSCDLYVAEFAGGKWINLRNLGANVNSENWDSHPNLSPDGTLLFFTSNRKGGFGSTDIYLCQKLENGGWSKAQNLGPAINTMNDEVTPFFHSVNQTLFFSSTGHIKNMGGYDIFKSRWLGDHWEASKNVGPLVNTPGNEYYFSIDGKGTRLFYAMAKDTKTKRESKQNFDLYSFPMPMEARPDAIVTLKGYLIDSVTGNPLTGFVLVIDKETGIEIAPKYINPTGYFEFDLISNKGYEIFVQGNNFFTVKEELFLEKDSTYSIFTRNFQEGKPFVFEALEFEENSYELGKHIEPQLNYIANFLKRYPMFLLKINGHTDADGDARYNLILSQKRAERIKTYLLQKANIEGRRIASFGYGESRPLVANNTGENKRLNRRVEFELILDPSYEGEFFLPMQEELLFEGEELFDPEFMEEEDFDFNWEEEDWEDWEEEEDWESIDQELIQEYDDFVPEEDFDE